MSVSSVSTSAAGAAGCLPASPSRPRPATTTTTTMRPPPAGAGSASAGTGHADRPAGLTATHRRQRHPPQVRRKQRDHVVPKGTPHDRETAVAKSDLGRRDGRAVVRARGHAALAGGMGLSGDHGGARRWRRALAGQDRSGAARRAHAPDVQDDQPAADKIFMLAFGLRGADLVRRDRASTTACTARTCPPRCRRSGWRCCCSPPSSSCG